MLDDRTILYSLAGVALILLAMIWFNNQQAKLERSEGASAGPTSDEEEGESDAWLLKFVQHNGSIVGETVALDGDQLILKQAGVFKAVPRAQATVEGQEIVLEGEIDWDACITAGTAWHQTNTKGIDPLVSEHLTKSEDVKHPALSAMKSEEE